MSKSHVGHMGMRWVRTVEMELPLVKLTVEPLGIQRVIADVARDLGYESLTTEQADTITDFLHGRDVLVCLPTGSGKSLYFALLPKVVDVLKAAIGVKFQRPNILVVITPLISLMEDQVAHFPAILIPSIATKGRGNLKNVHCGEYQLIFMSPEALFDLRNQDILRSEVYQEYLIGLAVDEAHCIKEW